MMRPMYGLKDVPRVRRKGLHEVLIKWMFRRQLYSEPGFHCVNEDISVAIYIYVIVNRVRGGMKKNSTSSAKPAQLRSNNMYVAISHVYCQCASAM